MKMDLRYVMSLILLSTGTFIFSCVDDDKPTSAVRVGLIGKWKSISSTDSEATNTETYLMINADGTVEFNATSQGVVVMISGKWDINKENQLIITFNDKDKQSITYEYFIRENILTLIVVAKSGELGQEGEISKWEGVG